MALADFIVKKKRERHKRIQKKGQKEFNVAILSFLSF